MLFGSKTHMISLMLKNIFSLRTKPLILKNLRTHISFVKLKMATYTYPKTKRDTTVFEKYHDVEVYKKTISYLKLRFDCDLNFNWPKDR
jgi:hypothetical protein